MERRKHTSRFLPVIFSLIFLCLLQTGIADAESVQNCSLTIRYLDEGEPITGASFALYRVGNLTDQMSFALEGSFAESGVSLGTQMTNEGWLNAARQLLAFAEERQVSPTVSGITNTNGNLVFVSLEPGLYLMSGDDVTVSGKTYHPMPACVMLPDRDENGNPAYSVSVEPKFDSQINGLRVKKTVKGIGDKDRLWHFTVTLSDTSVNGVFGDMEFQSGTAEFTLRHGETAEATGLPGGIAYTVEEEEADQDDYETTVTNGQGVLEGIIDVKFVNYLEKIPLQKDPNEYREPETEKEAEKTPPAGNSGAPSTESTSAPQTGDDLTLWPLAVVFALVMMLIIAGIWFLVSGRKRKDKRKSLLDRD